MYTHNTHKYKYKLQGAYHRVYLYLPDLVPVKSMVDEDVERIHQKLILRNSVKKLCVRLFILFLFTAAGGFLFRVSNIF